MQEIRIRVESEDYDSEHIYFSELECLPALQTLELHSCNLRSLRFTKMNTPSLTHLKLSNLNVFDAFTDCPDFFLHLPALKSFSAEHVITDGTLNALGDSLSRCPNLENVYTYKFHAQWGRNFCVLPKMERLTLRAEGMFSLEILSAPHLESLNVEV